MSVAELGVVVPTTDIVRATDELGNLRREAGEAEKSTDRMSQGMSRHFGKLKLAAIAAGTASAAAFASEVNRQDELGKMASRTGVAVEALSELEYAARLSDVSIGQLAGGLQRMSRNMVDNPEKFEALGIAVRDADGSMRSAQAVFADVAETISNIDPESPERAATAMELLGRAGADMIPLLEAGSAGIMTSIDEARSMGLTVTAEMAAQAAQFNDNITRLKANVGGLTSTLVNQVLPATVAFSDNVIRGAERLREGNWDAIVQGWSNAAGRLAEKARADLDEVAGNFQTLVSNVQTYLGGMATGAVDSIGRTAAALAAGASSIASSAITWAGDIVRGFIEGLASLYQAGVDAIANLARGMREGITGLISDAAGWGSDIAAGLAGGVTRGAGRVRDAVGSLAQGVQDWFTEPVEIQSPSKVFERFGGWLTQGLAQGIDGGAGQVQGSMQNIAGGMLSHFDGVTKGAENLTDVFDNVKAGFANMLSDMASRMMSSGLSGILGSLFGAIDPLAGALRGAGLNAIPSFAGGGYTGSGSRTGGVDGRGGFPAIIHPQETITDHTKAGAGAAANITYAPTYNISATSDASLARLEKIIEQDRVQFPQRVSAAIRNPRG